MSDHHPHSVVRHCDVAVIGGSAAGLAAALQLGRQRRSVIVVDAGEPRNAPAAHLHGVPGRDGAAPAELAAAARDEVRSYGGEVLDGRVAAAVHDGTQLELTLAGGHRVRARRVVVATGIVDVLPDIEGLEPHWGRDVIHCPSCHGFEVRDRRVVQVVVDPVGLHPTPLLRQLTEELTVVLHDDVAVDAERVASLRAAGVRVVSGTVRRVVEVDGRLVGLELGTGDVLDADAVVVGTRFRPRIEALDALAPELAAHPSGLGQVLVVGADGATSVPGLYGAGNVVDPSQQVLQAAAAGSWVGAMVGVDLAEEDVVDAARPSANRTDWDHRYGGERMWSGNPNGALVQEVAAMAPGRALDVGAGEGGDAVWLAEHGWQVTATDISARALDRVAAEAGRRSLAIECRLADANALDPYRGASFDLVSAHYASIPRTPDDRAVHQLLDAVAEGGTLLVVGHDLEPMRRPIDTATQSRAFDPDAYVRVEDVARVLAGRDGWRVEVHELRPRPAGAASSHHVDDVVLRVRRTTA